MLNRGRRADSPLSRTLLAIRWKSMVVRDPGRKVNHLRSFEITRSISSTNIGSPVPMMDFKVSKDKSIS